jgi:hypothetical protein
MVVAVEFIRTMGDNPLTSLVRANDNQFYVVKLPSSPCSARKIVNEILATRLAELLALPVLPAVVVTLLPHLHPEPAKTQLVAAGGSIPHSSIRCFGSRYPGTPGENLVVDFLPQQLLSRVRNLRDAFWGCLVFDLWTGKTGPRQAIFSRPGRERRSRYSVWLISHSSCFGGSNWAFADNLPLPFHSVRSVYSLVTTLDSFEPYLSRIESLPISKIQDCAKAIPTEWLAPDPKRLDRVIEILYERRSMVRQALKEAVQTEKKVIPNFS